MKRFLVLVCALLLLLLGTTSLYSAKAAPDFKLKDINTAKMISLSDYKGKVVVLNFWATWCPPCKAEIPDLVKLQKDYGDKLVIIGASFDDSESTVKTFYKNNKMNYPMVMATDKMSRDYGGIESIPATFIIDQSGNIVNQFVGSRTYDVFVKMVEPYLKGGDVVVAEDKNLAPDFTQKEIFKQTNITLSKQRGKIVMLNYWATWCPPCVSEIPDLIKLQSKYKDKLTIIGASFDDSVSTVKRFYTKYKMNYPVVMATDKMSSDYGGITGIPTTFFIDAKGKVLGKVVGSRSYSEFETMLLKVMKGESIDEGGDDDDDDDDEYYDDEDDDIDYDGEYGYDVPDESATVSADYNAFQLAMLEQINFARSDPAGYAEKYLKSYADKGKDNGAYRDLKSRKAIAKLTLNKMLCAAADKYAKYMANNNVFGHNANGTPFQRMKAEGYQYTTAGENIGCGSYNYYNAEQVPADAAREFVLMLIIDEGVAGVGHRKNILNSDYKELGVGFGRNTASAYHNYAVQNFGAQ